MTTTQTLLTVVAMLGVLGGASVGAAGDTSKPRPNVLMIAVDDLNDYVSILQNHPGIKTPNFDRLAKRSVNFTRAFCAAPLCNPSRVAVCTGMAPCQTGIYELSDLLQNSKPALAAVALEEQFRRSGYDTYQTGKYYHAGPANWWPEDRMTAAWTERKPPYSDHGPKLQAGNKVMGPGLYSIGPAPGGMNSMPDVQILQNTKGWLRQSHEKPFFIVHGINKPHVSFVVPQQFYDLYPLKNVVVPQTPTDDYSDIPPIVRSTVLKRQDLDQFARIHDREDGWKQVVQAYLASISFCDWVLGQILDELDASPYAGNTIVVLWSDHGYHIGEKEKLHKRALWTQSCRVPLLISVPQMATAGRSCAAPVSLLDLYPTLLDLCDLDVKVPQKVAGRSISRLLSDPDQGWPFIAVTSHGTGNAAASDARYRYIRYVDGSEELYDDQADPREYRNLAGDAQLKSVKGRLAAELPRDWVPSSGHKGSKNVDVSE